MATSVIRFEARTTIDRPIDEVFARLADLSGYDAWMHRDGMFRHCRETSGGPVRQGTTYADATRMGTFEGEVTEHQPPTRLAFTETLRWFGSPVSRARPEYTLTSEGTSTVVQHVAVGELYGWMRLMRPGAAWMARRERTRTLRSLERSWGPRR